jgi:hypothetical protein
MKLELLIVCYTRALQQLIPYRSVRINVMLPTHCIYIYHSNSVPLKVLYLMTKCSENNLQAQSYLTVLLGGLHKYDHKQATAVLHRSGQTGK